MDQLTLLMAFRMLLSGFCFSIGPWIAVGAFIAWIMPAPKGGQSGDIVVNVSQANGPK